MAQLEDMSAFDSVGAADRKRPAVSHEAQQQEPKMELPSDTDIVTEEMPHIITDLFAKINDANTVLTILRARVKWFQINFVTLQRSHEAAKKANDDLRIINIGLHSKVAELEQKLSMPLTTEHLNQILGTSEGERVADTFAANHEDASEQEDDPSLPETEADMHDGSAI
jgi:hypothetical protein